MGSVRLRKTGNGGLKFKRNFVVEWNVFDIDESTIIVENKNVKAAYSFGSQEPFDIDGVTFCNPEKDIVTSSTGRLHKIVSGQFFKSQQEIDEKLSRLTTFGAWCPLLPENAGIIVSLDDLEVDGIYEVSLVFSNGRKNGSEILKVNDEVVVELSDKIGCSVVGSFTATKTFCKFEIKSLDKRPPFINALIVKKTGFSPRVIAKIALS